MARNFLTVCDFSKEEVFQILSEAANLKKMSREHKVHQYLPGSVLGMFFEKASTRTRISFEVGISQLGGSAIFLTPEDIQIERGEPIKDTARVISRYVDCIVIRAFSHESITEWAGYSSVPVINGLTETHHPCQALTDVFTMKEIKGSLENVKLAYIGDSNNVLNSLLEICAMLGINLSIASPEGYTPKNDIWTRTLSIAEKSKAKIEVVQNPKDAVKNADFVYTDVWTSMGMEKEYDERLKKFKGFQVNDTLLSYAHPDVKTMHCLPARRGEEITDKVMESNNSIVFDQAENRLHVQKAILLKLLK